MTPLPAKIKIGYKDFKVIDSRENTDPSNINFGSCDWKKGEIAIYNGGNEIVNVDTLLHEICHLLLASPHLDFLSAKKEERICEIMATGFTTVFRDNPQVLEFISKVLGKEENDRLDLPRKKTKNN